MDILWVNKIILNLNGLVHKKENNVSLVQRVKLNIPSISDWNWCLYIDITLLLMRVKKMDVKQNNIQVSE